MDHPALSARGITKRFGRKVVLDGVDLDVWPGEAVALVGENGAGKTTLLRICAGLLAADAGEIRVSGAVGYCPQDAGLLDLLTADEHLLLFGRAIRQSREGSLAGGRKTLETFGFPLGEQAVSQDLSGGTRQKLNLALALLGDPALVLLDEPYQGFDRGTYVSFWDHVDAWRARGMAVLIVTHMLAELNAGGSHCRAAGARQHATAGRAAEGAAMSIRRVLAVAEAQARDLSRRRVAMIILVMLPLLFYMAVGSEAAFALVAGGTGMAWSVAGAALFLALAARRTDQRLVLAGYRPLDILVGRLLCLEGFALVLVAVFSVLMVSMSAPPSPEPLVLALVLTAAIAVPLGLAVAALLPRELEGALALIGIVGIEMSLPVDSDLAPVLPLYGPLRLIEAAAAAGTDIWSPIVHAVISAIVLLTVAAVLWWRRVRIVRHRS